MRKVRVREGREGGRVGYRAVACASMHTCTNVHARPNITCTGPVVMAHAVATMLNEMERSYLTAGFFRHTMYHRTNRIRQQQAMAKAAEAAQQAKAQGGVAGAAAGVVQQAKSFFPAFGASAAQPGGASSPGAVGTPAPAGAPPAGTPQATPASTSKSGAADDDDKSDDGAPAADAGRCSAALKRPGWGPASPS